MNDRRLGRFIIDEELITRDPQAIKLALRDCIVVRCEMRYDIAGFEYIALHDAFEPVPLGAQVPLYEAVLNYEQVGDVSIKTRSWVRK